MGSQNRQDRVNQIWDVVINSDKPLTRKEIGARLDPPLKKSPYLTELLTGLVISGYLNQEVYYHINGFPMYRYSVGTSAVSDSS